MLIVGQTTMTPQEEAAQIFADIVGDLTKSLHNLESILRRGQHACKLLGWNDKRDWFRWELTGYPEDMDVPSYRVQKGVRRLHIDLSDQDLVHRLGGKYAAIAFRDKTAPTERQFREGLDFLLARQHISEFFQIGPVKREKLD